MIDSEGMNRLSTTPNRLSRSNIWNVLAVAARAVLSAAVTRIVLSLAVARICASGTSRAGGVSMMTYWYALLCFTVSINWSILTEARYSGARLLVPPEGIRLRPGIGVATIVEE